MKIAGKDLAFVSVAIAAVVGAFVAVSMPASAPGPASARIAQTPGKTACVGPLTGRRLTVPEGMSGFGSVQGQIPLPLDAGEYVISIDDGPNPATTPALLDALDKACVRATFFLVGRAAAAHPALVREIVARGHGVGSHSFSHGALGSMPPEDMHRDVTGGVDAVERAAYGRPLPLDRRHLYRIPGAAGTPLVPPADWMAFFARERLVVAGYDISPADWRNSPPSESFTRLFQKIPDRGVIVLHDGQPNTLVLLPMALDEFARRRAKIVSLAL